MLCVLPGKNHVTSRESNVLREELRELGDVARSTREELREIGDVARFARV